MRVMGVTILAVMSFQTLVNAGISIDIDRLLAYILHMVRLVYIRDITKLYCILYIGGSCMFSIKLSLFMSSIRKTLILYVIAISFDVIAVVNRKRGSIEAVRITSVVRLTLFIILLGMVSQSSGNLCRVAGISVYLN